MPHKDRRQRLDYLSRYRLKHRPAPNVEQQVDSTLPPRGEIVFDEAGERVQCHVCGSWLKALNAHLRLHGLDASTYKEAYDLNRTASLWPPALKDKQRQAALDRGQGEIGRGHLPPGKPRPKGLPARLQSRVEESQQRTGTYFRGGTKKDG